jgi:hypothetical protein
MLNSTYLDRNAALASLPATVTVVLDTDRRAAKGCIRRAVTLLGIDPSLGGAVAAEHSCLQGGLALGLDKLVLTARIVLRSSQGFCRASDTSKEH